jgi:hypothetical protein
MVSYQGAVGLCSKHGQAGKEMTVHYVKPLPIEVGESAGILLCSGEGLLSSMMASHELASSQIELSGYLCHRALAIFENQTPRSLRRHIRHRNDIANNLQEGGWITHKEVAK